MPTHFEEGDLPVLKSLKLNPSEGFSVRYAKASESKFEALAQGQPVYTQKGFAVLLKLHADRSLKAGEYMLTGKATLVIEHRGKPSHEKEVEVAIPVTVVDKNEVVAQNSFGYKPYTEHRVLEVLATVLLIPLAIAIPVGVCNCLQHQQLQRLTASPDQSNVSRQMAWCCGRRVWAAC